MAELRSIIHDEFGEAAREAMRVLCGCAHQLTGRSEHILARLSAMRTQRLRHLEQRPSASDGKRHSPDPNPNPDSDPDPNLTHRADHSAAAGALVVIHVAPPGLH